MAENIKKLEDTDLFKVISSDKQDGYVVKMKDGSGLAFADKNGKVGKNRYASVSIIRRNTRNLFEKIRFGFKNDIVLYSVRRIDGKGTARITRSGSVIEKRGQYCLWTPKTIENLKTGDYKEAYMMQTLENEVNEQLKSEAKKYNRENKEIFAHKIKLTLKALKDFKEKVERDKISYNIINSSIENIKDKEQNINDANAKRYAEMSKTYAETSNQTDNCFEPSNE